MPFTLVHSPKFRYFGKHFVGQVRLSGPQKRYRVVMVLWCGAGGVAGWRGGEKAAVWINHVIHLRRHISRRDLISDLKSRYDTCRGIVHFALQDRSLIQTVHALLPLAGSTPCHVFCPTARKSAPQTSHACVAFVASKVYPRAPLVDTCTLPRVPGKYSHATQKGNRFQLLRGKLLLMRGGEGMESLRVAEMDANPHVRNRRPPEERDVLSTGLTPRGTRYLASTTASFIEPLLASPRLVG